MTRHKDPLPTYTALETDPGVHRLFEAQAIRPDGPNQQAVSLTPETDDTQSMSIDALAYGPHATRFSGKLGGTVATGRRVGWTLRNSNNRIVALPDGTPAAWGFTINPQGITYDHANRNQMFATKSGFYVDQFGPGPATITVRQLVASGGYQGEDVYAAREDVLTFLSLIYEPAIDRSSGYRVFFHDMHLDSTSGASGWHVFFPNNPVSVQRSVDLHNVWLVQITMQTLSPMLYSGIAKEWVADATRKKATYQYKVQFGDTLHKIAKKAIREDSHRYSLEQMMKLILRLNPAVRTKRTITVMQSGLAVNPWLLQAPAPPAFPGLPGTTLETRTVNAMSVAPGETLILPR
jgi:hypothetical protein